ncbi:MAG: ATP phosphoribosyltransferase [Ponticaulis sp.]|nr:ATP phosphoribosyltransferase [Ponticaulis sp.]
MSRLTFAIPSKGRLKDQTEDFFADCGLKLRQSGGDRGYTATMQGVPDVQVLLLSASEIASGLLDGTLHFGVTGEDLLREKAQNYARQVWPLRALGFGFADMVVAVPEGWIDVETVADLEDVGHIFRARHGRRMRVATKYLNSTRRFFTEKGMTQYRLVDSAGATEAAPASGTAELIVDITTTGSTLRANALRILKDGVILKSQAQLTGSLQASWDDDALMTAKHILDVIEARRRAREKAILVGGRPLASQAEKLQADVEILGDGLVLPAELAISAANSLTNWGFGPVSVQTPEFLFLDVNQVFVDFSAALKGRE